MLEGTPDGRPPLVMLHDPALHRAMWQPVLTELCAVDPGRQVLALDLPAGAAAARWPGRDIESAVATVNDAVTWARLDAPVVVGHSVAAVVATVYAARYPACGVVNVGQRLTPDSLAGDIEAVDLQAALARLCAAGSDYLFIACGAVEPGYQRWLRQVLPQADIEVFADGGHFPQLACPRRFAACLCSTARWGAVI